MELLRRLYRKHIKHIREYKFTNIYPTANIGKGCVIGSYTEIGDGVSIGQRSKIGAFVFIPKGVTIGKEVFIGPKVSFTNDKYPKAVGDWRVYPTVVGDGASIGANSTIVCGVRIGMGAKIGAGSVVTKDVPPGVVVYGNPAKEKESSWSR